MAIVVVGGGAIGLQVAGRLTHAGVPTALLGRGAAVHALQTTPLQIRFPEGEWAVRLVAASSPADLPPAYRQPALVILCVKSYDTAGALAALAALAPTQILTLQNGIGNEAQLAEAFGPERIIAGAITTSVEPNGPSGIVITKTGGIGLAPLAPTTALTVAQMALARAGFPLTIVSDPQALKWSKALLNMLGNAQAAILDLPVPRIYADTRLLALDLRAAREALAVMAAMGVQPLNLPGYPAATIAKLAQILPTPLVHLMLRRLVGAGRGGKAPSLLRDLRAGRTRSEGEQLYGAVAAEAARQGLPAPVNAALWRILGAIVRGERPWESLRGQPERLLAEIEG